MSEQPVVYAVPTHLPPREPFVFGRSLDEFAKLVAVACVALKLAFSDGLPIPVRLPLVGLVIVVGIAWALLRVQRYSLDSWLCLAFRFGASPRRRVWRPTSMQVANQPDWAHRLDDPDCAWLPDEAAASSASFGDCPQAGAEILVEPGALPTGPAAVEQAQQIAAR